MIIAEINSFAKNKASQLTILQGACLIENPNSEINIIQDYARLACRLIVRNQDVLTMIKKFWIP